MFKSEEPLLGFTFDAAKKSIVLSRILKNCVLGIERSLFLHTSTPKYHMCTMDINFSKHFNDAKKCEPNHLSFAVVDQDSGYVSYHQESNSDSSLENVAGNSANTPFMPVYLSEDALLEKPDLGNNKFDIDLQIQNSEYEETINTFNTPMTKMIFDKDEKSMSRTVDSPETILSSSVISETSLYNGFDTSIAASDMSIEILPIEPIIMEKKDLDLLPSTYTQNSPTESFANIRNNQTNKLEPVLDHSFNNILNNANKSGNVKPLVTEMDISLDSTLNENVMSVSNINIDNNIENAKLLLVENNSIGSNISVTNDFSCFMPPSSNCSSQASVACSSKSTKPIKINLPKSKRILNSVTNTELLVPKEKKRLTMIFSKTNKENKENVYSVKRKYPSLTPEKSFKNPIDPNFSPDLFGDDDTLADTCNYSKEEPTVNLPAKEKYITKKDNLLLKRVQSSLSGVLPPPSMTVVNFSTNEILSRLELIENYFWDSNDNQNTSETQTNNTSLNDSSEGSKSLLVNVNTSNDYISKPWPNILEDRYHGLHHNRSKVAEQIEDLCDKFAKRYVSAETQSTCTVFETNFGSPSKKKTQRQRWTVKSPGRRLSHLARRRITFSSANLQIAGSNLAGSRARQILVDARKINLQNKRKSPKKTPKKTPSKSPRFKSRTPSSSAKKKLAMRFKKISGEFEKSNNALPSTSADSRIGSLKKALFKSPDKSALRTSMSVKRPLFSSPEDKNFVVPSPNTSGNSFKGETQKVNPRRALFVSPIKSSPSKIKKSPFRRAVGLSFDKKRKRSECDDIQQENQSKLPRNMTDTDSKMPRSMSVDIKPSQSECGNKAIVRTRSEISLNRSGSQMELSDIHKKKLQWAVYEALKSQNIKPTHAQYKVFASVLARVTRRFLPLLSGKESGGGTSERMLRIARHHVYAVMKGKTVDEVVNDYLKNRAKMQKPQGYVALEEVHNAKNISTSANKDNVFQDRGNTIESWEKQKLEQLGKPKSENKIDRIRKVINFGDDNR